MYLEELELAKCTSKSQEHVNILTSTDYYWTFMTAHSKKGESHEVVAIDTKLDWVLSRTIEHFNEWMKTGQASSVNFSATHVRKIEAQTYWKKQRER